jgi:mono/diheme cytochrome c family protein
MIHGRNALHIVGAIAAGALAACSALDPADAPPAPIVGSHAGDPERGLAYAREACAACHAVAADETLSPLPDAPPFGEIARMPGMTSLALTAWLQSSHEQMPNFIVAPERIDDLAAYLESLDR